jgi:hypothetical protein
VFDLHLIADSQIIEHWGVPDRFALLARPACSTSRRADSVIAVAASWSPGADPVDIEAVLRASMACQTSPLCAALASKGRANNQYRTAEVCALIVTRDDHGS